MRHLLNSVLLFNIVSYSFKANINDSLEIKDVVMFINHLSLVRADVGSRYYVHNREFKKLRRQLQGKRDV